MILDSLRKKRFGWLLAGLGVFCLAISVGFRVWAVREVPARLNGTVADEAVSAFTSSSPMVLIDAAPFLAGSRPFWGDTAVPEACSKLPDRPILALPHYLPAAERIERALAPWKNCRQGEPIARVIVISPDHYRRLSSGSATLGNEGYATPLGAVQVDAGVRDALSEKGVEIETDVFVREHGAGLFPVFVKQFFPDAAYTPIVISRQATREEVRGIETVVRDALAQGDTLVIVTADFSHYLSKDQADTRDWKTLSALDRHDADFFWDANDDYTDFGRGVWLGMELAGSTSTFRALDRMNSVEVGGSNAYTTSFLFGWWE